MGIGDNIMATGLARGAAERGKRVAFGRRGNHTKWDQNSKLIFKNNPNIAIPGTENKDDVEWIDYRKGHRQYNHMEGQRWVWNKFYPNPGEFYFDKDELNWGLGVGSNFIVIEPNVNPNKSWSDNKIWPYDRYDKVAEILVGQGFRVIQFSYGPGHVIPKVQQIQSPSFRLAASALSRASLYIGAEGGMHHAAAAVGVKGVVLFGGFIAPHSTGYDFHTNITNDNEACGSLKRCEHCIKAMKSISIDRVVEAALEILNNRKVS